MGGYTSVNIFYGTSNGNGNNHFVCSTCVSRLVPAVCLPPTLCPHLPSTVGTCTYNVAHSHYLTPPPTLTGRFSGRRGGLRARQPACGAAVSGRRAGGEKEEEQLRGEWLQQHLAISLAQPVLRDYTDVFEEQQQLRITRQVRLHLRCTRTTSRHSSLV